MAIDIYPLLGTYGFIYKGEQFIVPHLLRHEASIFVVSFEEPPHLYALYDKLKT